MSRLTQAISKLFVILVMLFGSPPVVRLRDLRRRPAIVLVASAPHPADAWPPALPSPAAAAPGDHKPTHHPDQRPQRTYLPVKAA